MMQQILERTNQELLCYISFIIHNYNIKYSNNYLNNKLVTHKTRFMEMPAATALQSRK